MDILLTQSLFQSWLFVFARLLGCAAVDPLMGRLPWGLRLFVAGALAWVWAPGLAPVQVDPLTAAGGGVRPAGARADAEPQMKNRSANFI